MAVFFPAHPESVPALLTVKGYEPEGTAELITSVRVDEFVEEFPVTGIGFGLKLAVTPVGRPLTDKLIGSTLPVTLIVVVTAPPVAGMASAPGLIEIG